MGLRRVGTALSGGRDGENEWCVCGDAGQVGVCLGSRMTIFGSADGFVVVM